MQTNDPSAINTLAELEITIGHFPTNIAILAEQKLIAKINLLYIVMGKL